MFKKRLTSIIILLAIFIVLLYFRGQQVSEARAKAFEVAIQKARSLGYDVDKMYILKNLVHQNILMVSFKSERQNAIDDLEIYLYCDNIYGIDILGIYKDVNPDKDADKILLEILDNKLKKLSDTIREVK